MKILAVDDDKMVLEILKTALEAAGYRDVDTATSPQTAMAMIEAAQVPYELLMFDIQMPGMSGIDLCAWVKRRRAYENTPVIMVTAMSDRAHVAKAFDAGAIDYVTKPFDPIELTARVGMANRLILQSVRSRRADAEALDGRALIDETEHTAFSEPVTILGLPGVIGIASMHNYLTQLSRAGLFATSIIAIRVHGLEGFHHNLSNEDFSFLLGDVAEGLCETLRGSEFLLAYAGNGTFVAAVTGLWFQNAAALSTRATDILAHMGISQGAGTENWLSVRCGEPVRIGVLFSGNSAARSIETALERLDRTLWQRPTMPSVSRAPSSVA